MIDSKKLTAGERAEDYATEREFVDYWIGKMRDQLASFAGLRPTQ